MRGVDPSAGNDAGESVSNGKQAFILPDETLQKQKQRKTEGSKLNLNWVKLSITTWGT